VEGSELELHCTGGKDFCYIKRECTSKQLLGLMPLLIHKEIPGQKKGKWVGEGGKKDADVSAGGRKQERGAGMYF